MSEQISRATRYGVLAADVEHEIEIKRSRFRCYLGRVDSEEVAREFVDLVREEHRLARHHCTAWLLGPDRMLQRSNDDGEPSGTAGAPMLDALAQFTRPDESAPDLSDVVAVVVRYFGGVLLGAGGLVRAYSGAVSQALAEARFATHRRMRILALEAPHAEAGRWQNELRAAGVDVLEAEYGGSAARLRLAVVDEDAARATLAARIASITQGAGVFDDAGTAWVDLGG